jgi:hypothetical protein
LYGLQNCDLLILVAVYLYYLYIVSQLPSYGTLRYEYLVSTWGEKLIFFSLFLADVGAGDVGFFTL